ncbi:hypothetical protein [Pseudoduganella sp. UC29_71]|jgi:hypothetical protein|uniref:hypothetical protein n=1 Tax=Pseudoduganella sp. UC29_71 TaxID=3350174 RepID=UPI00366A5599
MRIDLAVVLSLAVSLPAAAQQACVAEALPTPLLGAPLVVLGEVHGTEEVPVFLARYLCAVAAGGKPVKLALEMPADEQARLDAYIGSAGSPEQTAALLAGPFWRRAFQDGRSSAAMLRLLQSVRAMRAAGMDMEVVAYDSGSGGAAREAVMAQQLRAAVARHSGSAFVVLTGGLHATRTRGNRFNPEFESMTYRLADLKPLSLTVVTDGGSAWVCTGPSAAACGARNWTINQGPLLPAGSVVLDASTPQFDGSFHVGKTTASPPAVAP